MKHDEERKFSWRALFISMTISFSLFSLFLKMIDGSSYHSSLFFKIAIGSLIGWLLAFSNNVFKVPVHKKKSKIYE